ncbi:MAG TPA: RDD family protein [Acidimicrobiales bacterium]
MTGPPPTPYATFGTRLVGWLIDWVITSILGSILLLPLHAVRHTGGATADASPSSTLGVTITDQGALLFVLFVIIYTTACTGSQRGQTVGMTVVHARAVDAVTGAPIGYGRALGRVVVEYVLFVLLIAPWVFDMVFPLWDSRRQTLHDKVTNTVVITIRGHAASRVCRCDTGSSRP